MSVVQTDIVIQSKPENLSLVEDYIDKVCTDNSIGPDVYGNILISTTEAVNNAILHGNSGDESKSVTVGYSLDKEAHQIVFTIADEGSGFDYNNLPDPTAPENITMVGGRGVFLIKQLADTVIFSKEGSIIELLFKI